MQTLNAYLLLPMIFLVNKQKFKTGFHGAYSTFTQLIETAKKDANKKKYQ